MEYWKVGIMGLGENSFDEIISAFLPNIPEFHHSSIPGGATPLDHLFLR